MPPIECKSSVKEGDMQDLKSFGGQPEFKLGNREAAFLVGALFIILVVVFGLGVMVGKRVYGQLPVDAALHEPPSTIEKKPICEPAPVQPGPLPSSTSERFTFHNLRDTGTQQITDTGTPPPPTATTAATGATPPSTTTPASTAADTRPTATTTGAPVKAAPALPATSTSTSTGPAGWKYSIQIATLTDQAGAEKYIQKLKAKGLDAWILNFTQKSTGNSMYVVRIGHYKERKEADDQLNALKTATTIPPDSLVITR